MQQQIGVDAEDIDDVDLDSIDINKYKLDEDEEQEKDSEQIVEDQKTADEIPSIDNNIVSNNTPIERQLDIAQVQNQSDTISSRSSSSSSISSTQHNNGSLNTTAISNSVNLGEKFNQNVYTNTGNWSINVARTVRHLHDNLHEASNTTLEYVKAYKLATEQIHDTINQNVVSVQQLVTKAQQLNEELRGIEMMHQQVKETKKLLGFLEDAVNNLTKVPRK